MDTKGGKSEFDMAYKEKNISKYEEWSDLMEAILLKGKGAG